MDAATYLDDVVSVPPPASMWPGFEDTFEFTPSASSIQMAEDFDPDGPLLDAISRLRSENERLSASVEIARALGGLSHSTLPDRWATSVQAAIRGFLERARLARARAQTKDLAARRIQRQAGRFRCIVRSRTVAAIRIQRAIRRFQNESVHETKSLLRCRLLRERSEHAAALCLKEQEHAAALTLKEQEHVAALLVKEQEYVAALAEKEQEHAVALGVKEQEHLAAIASREQDHAEALAKKEAALERLIEKHCEQQAAARCERPPLYPIAYAVASGSDDAPGGNEVATLREENAQLRQELTAARMQLAAPAAPLSPRAEDGRAVMERLAETRLREAEELITRLVLEKSELAHQLEEQQDEAKKLADSASQHRVDKEAAEDLASSLLAQQLDAQEKHGAGCSSWQAKGE